MNGRHPRHRKAVGSRPHICPGREAFTRRDFLKAAAAAGVALSFPGCSPAPVADNGMTAATAILRAGYDQQLADVISAGFDLVPPPDVRGKRVLLKMNLVDLPRDGKPVVTDPAVLVAAAEAFRKRGAAEIVIADGPALQRDAWDIVDAIGLTTLLRENNLTFVDLNTTEPTRQPNAASFTGLDHLFFGRSVLDTDVFVSMPKMKMHHWLGVSLSMKNMIGTTSGVVYGMPRNRLHLIDPTAAVLDCNHTRPIDYAIVDGIIGLEGDGPVRGTPINVGVLVMGANAAAVDATASRIMGINPLQIGYLRQAAGDLGPINESSIEQRGEAIASVRQSFQVLPHQISLKL